MTRSQALEWMEALPVAAAVVEYSEGRFRPVFVNERIAQAFGDDGFRVESLFSDDLSRYVHQDDVEQLRTTLYKSRITGGTYRCDFRLKEPGGTFRGISLKLSSLPRNDGSRLIFLVFSDVRRTESQQVMLDDAYERLVNAVNNTPGGIVVMETVNGKSLTPLYTSRGMDRLLGGTRDELSAIFGSNVYDGVHPDDREAAIRAVESAVRDLSDFQVELRLKRVVGDYLWVEIKGSVDIAENHRVIYLSVLDYSIDQESQRIQKRVLDSFARHAYRYIYFVGCDNDSFRSLSADKDPDVPIPESGDDFEAEISLLVDRYVAEEDREPLKRHLMRDSLLKELEGKDDVVYYFTTVLDDGERRFKEAWLSWIDRDRHTLALVLSDHTVEHLEGERRRKALADALEAAERASKAKGEFLSSMSHDIRTPLNAIIGFTQMSLDDETASPQMRERLEKVASSSHFLLSLVNDVLDMSRIENGRTTLSEAAFDIAELLGDVDAIIAPQCESQGIAYRRHVADGALGRYLGDALKIQQVLINILGNSVKFTPAGGTISLDVDARGTADRYSLLTFRASDTGKGMSQDFIPRIFEPFAQESDDWTNERKGAGLGLAICKSLVSLMHGDITVRSALGKGTAFEVVIPLETVGGASARESGPSPENEAVDLAGRRVLLVEDNEMNMEIACYDLSKLGLSVDTAHDGIEALEAFRSAPKGTYDAIITDIVMPRMGGKELASAIRALDRDDAAAIPIIAMSANAFEENAREAMMSGIDAYVIKPTYPETLRRTLSACIRKTEAAS